MVEPSRTPNPPKEICVDIPAIVRYQLPAKELFKTNDPDHDEYFMPDQARSSIREATIQMPDWSMTEHGHFLKRMFYKIRGSQQAYQEYVDAFTPWVGKALKLNDVESKILQSLLNKRRDAQTYFNSDASQTSGLEWQKSRISLKDLEYPDLFYQYSEYQIKKAPDYVRDVFNDLFATQPQDTETSRIFPQR